MRQIIFKFSNRALYTFVALLVLATGFFVVNAAVNKNVAWHSASQVEVDAGGLKSLQDAIDDGSLGGSEGVSWDEISGVPAGFADGIDNIGNCQICIETCTYEHGWDCDSKCTSGGWSGYTETDVASQKVWGVRTRIYISCS
jgi:hypothetical protein